MDNLKVLRHFIQNYKSKYTGSERRQLLRLIDEIKKVFKNR